MIINYDYLRGGGINGNEQEVETMSSLVRIYHGY